MDFNQLRTEFENKIGKYESLGKNVVESIRILLHSANIKNLSIYFRVKDVDSFLEKIERKSYEKPFQETEDICGIRIICYYQKDIAKIEQIIKTEFDIIESFNKESNLEYNEFGYRSHHLIASIKKEWEKTPNFRGLSKLKFELQVRTVLMHAWAEIEHNLAYKSELQTPKQFRRKLHRISAKLEEADEQFEELKKESEEYQNKLLSEAKSNKLVTENNTELNIDSLQAFMDSNFPKRIKGLDATGKLLNQMVEYDISLTDLKNAWDKIEPKFKEMEQEYLGESNGRYSKWAQAGIARFVLDLTNENYRKRLKSKKVQDRIGKLMKKYFA
jgi:ppGpp synthetase/RelA/SpoT-type nucleotidyltranferase